jgi:mercuric ion binding protein
MKLIALLFIIGLTFGCQQSSNETNQPTEKEEKTSSEKVKVTPNKMLLMEVDGMSCVMGCGSSIRKELYATNGVSEVEFDFEDGRETQIAKIKFNSDKVTPEQMVKIVNTMNEKQFTVGKVTEEDIESSENEETVEDDNIHSSTNNEEPKIQASTLSKIKLPNFLDIITSFLSPKTFKISFI